MLVEIVSIFTKREDIQIIINKIKNYSFDEVVKHRHFDFSLDEKLVDVNKIKEIFSKFELVKSIELRENEKKQMYYSLNYELEDETFVVVSLALDSGKPIVINAFHAQRNYKNFEKSLRKNYGQKFV